MKKHNHQFGRIPSPEDARDDQHLLGARKSTRNSRTWNDKWIVADQGMTPECVAFSWSHWLANKPIRQFIDPHGLYEGCKMLDGYPEEEGTFVRIGAQILKKAGMIEEYKWARSLASLVYAVLELGPVVVGTDWYEGMEEGPVLQATGEILGGHAYLIVGANQKTKMFTIKNSWGRNWGAEGHARISFDDMKTLMKADGEVCLAIESQPHARWLEA